MSRYTIPAKNPNYRVTVGFDNPLQTFFVQVEDTTKEDEAEAMVCWAGGMPEEITNIETLKETVAPYANIDPYTEKQLILDHGNRTKPSALQRFAAQKLRELEIKDG